MHFHYSIYILFFVVIMLFSIYIDIRVWVCVCGGGVYIWWPSSTRSTITTLFMVFSVAYYLDLFCARIFYYKYGLYKQKSNWLSGHYRTLTIQHYRNA